jgi:hypothetical protein
MPSLSEQITKADRRIELLKLQVQQQVALIDCLHSEHYDVKRERRALDAMLDELSLMQRYRLSLYQEASSVGEARKKAVIWVGGRATSGSLGLQSSS